MRQELGSRYFRIEPKNENINHISLDGVSKENIWKIIDCGMDLIKDERENLLKLIPLLMPCGRQDPVFTSNRNRYISTYMLHSEAYSGLHKIMSECQNDCLFKCHPNWCEERTPYIDKLRSELKNFEQSFGENIIQPYNFFGDPCVVCQLLSIGFLVGVDLLKPENYLEHVCINGWTPFHFAAANDQVDSIIYLLKEKLFEDGSYFRRVEFNSKDPNEIYEYELVNDLTGASVVDRLNYIEMVFENTYTHSRLFSRPKSAKDLSQNNVLNFYENLKEYLIELH